MDQLNELLKERPCFHQPETEVQSSSGSRASLVSGLDERPADRVCYGLGPEVLSYIAESVRAGGKTLETGAGSSTLVFALCGAEHVAITPSGQEVRMIREYAAKKNISMARVRFVEKASEDYLPLCDVKDLDLVLLDGKHAFPWPMVDWFYAADKLKRGGLLILDDVQLRSVALLAEFMQVDPDWKVLRDFAGKTQVFQKVGVSIRDVAWHMQPFMLLPEKKVQSRGIKAIMLKVLQGLRACRKS